MNSSAIYIIRSSPKVIFLHVASHEVMADLGPVDDVLCYVNPIQKFLEMGIVLRKCGQDAKNCLFDKIRVVTVLSAAEMRNVLLGSFGWLFSMNLGQVTHRARSCFQECTLRTEGEVWEQVLRPLDTTRSADFFKLCFRLLWSLYRLSSPGDEAIV